MFDLLSDVLTRLSVQGTLYFRTEFTPPFGVRVPDYVNVARFHYVFKGTCRLTVAGLAEPVVLEQGDLAIIPHGASHCLLSADLSDDAAVPLETVLEQSGYDGRSVLVYGGAEAGDTSTATETRIICGHFSFAPGGRHLILERLPAYLHIKRYGESAGAWLSETLRLIGAEAEHGLPGSELIALRLAETVFAHAIRYHLREAEAAQGPLAGFADRQVSRALEAIHAKPERQWTVEELAREAGMSRSGFAQKFVALLEVTPMEYLKRWRMQVARDAIATRGFSVSEAADSVGYASEAAFSRAFKTETGRTPSSFQTKRRRP